MLTTCNNCGKKITIQMRQFRMHKHHFCNRKCFFEYRNNHIEDFKSKRYDTSTQKKLKKLTILKDLYKAENEMRNECNKCNHLPVCKDELKNNLSGDCPYYEPES